jgi:hypothetical protein
MKTHRIIQVAEAVMALAILVLFGIRALNQTNVCARPDSQNPACAGSAQEVKP